MTLNLYKFCLFPEREYLDCKITLLYFPLIVFPFVHSVRVSPSTIFTLVHTIVPSLPVPRLLYKVSASVTFPKTPPRKSDSGPPPLPLLVPF